MSDFEGTFVRYLDTECGYAAHTVVTYRRVVQDFLAFLVSRRIELRCLCREDVSSYVFRLRTERGNGARSVRLKLQIIKAFLSFLKEYHGGAAPRLELGPKDFNYKVEQQDAQAFSEEQLTALMESANACCRTARKKLDEAGGSPTRLLYKQFLAALRDRALLALLIATGLRIAEALGICLDDFDYVEHTILIGGKGKKLRKVFQHSAHRAYRPAGLPTWSVRAVIQSARARSVLRGRAAPRRWRRWRWSCGPSLLSPKYGYITVRSWRGWNRRSHTT